MEGPDLPSSWSHCWDYLGLIFENKSFKCHHADWLGAYRLPEVLKSRVAPQTGSHGGVCILYNFVQNIHVSCTPKLCLLWAGNLDL